MTTNDTLDMHRPAEAFRDYLEDEVIHEFRRRRTFQRLRAAAVIIVSVGIGASATLASAQVRGDARRDSLREASKAEAFIAMARLGLAKAQLSEQEKAVAAGVRPSASLSDAQVQLREAEEEVARVILNGREIEATGLPPRDDLNAPLVKGEDFVKERIENQMMTANRKLQAAQQNRDEAARRAAVGASSELEVADADVATTRARGDLAVLVARASARKEFLEKGTPVDELTRRVERTQVQQAVVIAQQALRNAQRRLDLVATRQKVGAATDVDLLRARLEVSERELDLRKAAERLDQIK